MSIINSNKQPLPSQSQFGLEQGMPIMKKKKICGLVTTIIDGNTFEISVPEIGENTINGDKQTKTIRIHGMDKPSASTLSGILAKLELEKMIVGRTVECEVIEKGDSDQLIAVVPKKYLRSPFAFTPNSEN